MVEQKQVDVCTLHGPQRVLLREMMAEYGLPGNIVETVGDEHGAFYGFADAASYWVSTVRQIYEVEQQIYYCFVDSMEVSAFATRLSDGTYCVVLYLGAMLHPCIVSENISYASSPANFLQITPSEIFDRAKGTGPNPTIFEEVADIRVAKFQTHARETLLRNKMKSVPLDFIILHELGHIINGHLALGDSVAGALAIVEGVETVTSRDEFITSQTLEMDADSFALNLLLTRYVHVGHQLHTGTISEGLARDTDIIVMAAHCLFKAFDNEPYSQDEPFTGSHPHAMQRSFTVQTTIPEYYHKKMGMVLEYAEYFDHFNLALVAVEEGFKQFTGRLEVGNLMAIAPGFGDYVVILLARWAKILPDLTKAKLGRHNLTPAQIPAA